MALNVAGEFAVTLEQAAKPVHAKMLVVVSPEDHTVNPRPVVMLDSACGHNSRRAFRSDRSWRRFWPIHSRYEAWRSTQ